MRKINYPTDSLRLNDFHKKYRDIFNPLIKSSIDTKLAGAPPLNNIQLTFDILVTSNFAELIAIKSHLEQFVRSFDVTNQKNGKDVIENSFNELFNYSKLQPAIANFFMNEKHLGMKTCYYCGIDYINSFKDIADYENFLDFINRASYGELRIIKGIGDKMAIKITAKRKQVYITSLSQITKSIEVITELKSFNFKNSHNHFTLDHVLPQSDYKFLSLCLYNLVPSCYSCNAKFKKDKNFIDDNSIISVSPSSSDYTLAKNLNFKILYSGKFEDIKSTSDFILVREIEKDEQQIEEYLSIFKLDGRYAVHKDLIIEMIEKRINYPEGKIILTARDLRKSIDETRKIIFGREIFDPFSPSPLHKLRRDIAKDLKII